MQFGVYVHIPFCAKRCDYCAFATWTDRHHLTEPYVAAVPGRHPARRRGGYGSCDERVLRRWHALAPAGRRPGGHPRRDPSDGGGRSHRRVQSRHHHRRAARPPTGPVASTGSASGCSRWCRTCSQSLGRTHDPDNVRAAVAAARRAGFESFNLDLIYGAVGESVDDWERTVRGALELEPPHVSAYGLTVEPGTPLAGDPDRHPDDDDQADKYELADELLRRRRAGQLRDLELGPARPRVPPQPAVLGRRATTSGFGCAAHSHRAGRRYWNVRTPDRYIELIEAGSPGRGSGGVARRRGTPDRGAPAQPAHSRRCARATALDADDLPGLVEPTANASSSPGPVGSWPTRCRSACSDC